MANPRKPRSKAKALKVVKVHPTKLERQETVKCLRLLLDDYEKYGVAIAVAVLTQEPGYVAMPDAFVAGSTASLQRTIKAMEDSMAAFELEQMGI